MLTLVYMGAILMNYDPDDEYECMLKRLKDICNERKISNYALAKYTGLSTSSISKLMNGETRPYLDTLLKICKTLGISLMELQEDDMSDRSEEEELVRKYRLMNAVKRNMANIYMDVLLSYNVSL